MRRRMGAEERETLLHNQVWRGGGEGRRLPCHRVSSSSAPLLRTPEREEKDTTTASARESL